MTPDEVRMLVYRRAGGRCHVCKTRVPWPGQLAHKIPQSKVMMKKYGRAVIHHPLNMELVCGLYCNDRVSISNHPVAIAELVTKIRRELENKS